MSSSETGLEAAFLQKFLKRQHLSGRTMKQGHERFPADNLVLAGHPSPP